MRIALFEEAHLPGVLAVIAEMRTEAYPGPAAVATPYDALSWLGPAPEGGPGSGRWVALAQAHGTSETVTGHVQLAHVPVDSAVAAACRPVTGTSELMEVQRLLVAPHARNHGAGSQLLATAVWRAEARGRTPILQVADQLTDAIRAYTRFGFTVIADKPGPDASERLLVMARGDISARVLAAT